jgi:serine/threonine protein kinase
MITSNGVCRIVDFGLSATKKRFWAASVNRLVATDHDLMYYLAPELLEHGTSFEFDQKTDVFAYGVTTLALFQEQLPHFGKLKACEISKLTKLGIRMIIDRKSVPADIASLINIAWHQNKDERPEFAAIVTSMVLGGAPVGVNFSSTSPKIVADIKSTAIYNRGINSLSRGVELIGDVFHRNFTHESEECQTYECDRVCSDHYERPASRIDLFVKILV